MIDLSSDCEPLADLAVWLESYQPKVRIAERGRLLSVGDGIVWISGLPSAAMDDIIDFEDGSRALVFDLAKDRIGAILLKEMPELTAGIAARLAGLRLGIPVGDELLGRVVSPLGEALDGGEPLKLHTWHSLEQNSPPIAMRDFVHDPLYSGIKIVDTLIPIGKGQRQLLVGDDGLGRSSLAIDTIINQRGRDVFCIYVLIGQKRSSVVSTLALLKEYQALDYTTIVVAESSSLPGLLHLAPFAGCAVAEYWMEQGHDTLVVYDDLTTHARNYRELSLLLRRPPGREAYPGDIFSIHARLLERATCLSSAHGGGSMTALPIIETQQGEISSYIPTNLISITDGQIYFDRELFNSGFRPAIDIALSVSRIGGKAQHPRIKEEAGRMKLDFLQFLELEIFASFGARLEATMEQAIRRGRILREVLKQDRLMPLPERFQLAWLVAFNDGLLNEEDPQRIRLSLVQLQENAATTELTLDSPRADWNEAVRTWLQIETERVSDEQT